MDSRKFSLYECSKCQRRFTKKSSLVRHLNAGTCKAESFSYPRKTPSQCCDNCKIKFSTKGSLVRHLKAGICKKPKTKVSKTSIECNDCGQKFSKKCRLVSHFEKCNGKPKEYTKIACLKCDFKVLSKSEMKKHYSENHGISFKLTNATFQSFDEFRKWMNDIERKNTFRFSKVRTRKAQTHTVEEYLCHRSGKYVDSCVNKRRKRVLKHCGSKKIQGWCPAELKVKILSSDGTCEVQYQETHIGHNVKDEEELRHVYLNKEEKLELATCIAEGVSIPQLKRMYLSEADTKNYSRISTVNLKDLHNIASSHVVLRNYALPFNDDELDINAFIEKYRESILYYKRQGEADTKYHTLRDEDLVIVFMNKGQELVMKLFDGKLVCFDGIYGTDSYEFIIHTMLIVDTTSSEGKPVAFLISNRNDKTVIDIMLKNIRDKVGIIKTKSFMTDMLASYYNSWIDVMGDEPEYYLFCTWHVREAWRRIYSKIADKEMRKYISHKLTTLINEERSSIFEGQLTEFLEILESDPQTEAFLRYFKENYLLYTHRWAYCYRLESGINKNMHIEVFYRKFKVSVRNKKKIKTSADCLHYILDYLSVQRKDDQLKPNQMQLISRLDCLRDRHHSAVEYLEKNESVNVCYVDEETFIIQSFEESTEDIQKTYTVIRNELKECVQTDSACQLFCNLCGICFHEYRCSCTDFSIRNNMCKHIHAIGICTSRPNRRKNECLNNVTICVDVETNFQNNIDFRNAKVEDYTVDHIPLQYENTENNEAEKMKIVTEEMKELFANFISYASSTEQLYEIKEKYLLPIKPTLLDASKQ